MKIIQTLILGLLANTLYFGCSKETKKDAAQVQYFGGIAPDLKSDGPHVHAVRLSMKTKPGVERFYCSGVLVAPKIVMTAAHCLVSFNEITWTVVGPYAASTLKAALINGFESEVLETKYPKDFGMYSTYAYGLDVGFMILKDPAPQDNVVEVASEESIQNWMKKSVPPYVLKGASYGQTQDNSASSGKINVLDVPFVGNFGPLKDPVSFELSNRSNSTIDAQVGKSLEFMAGFLTRTSCPGDSGGGVFFEEKPGSWKLAGITSRSIGIQTKVGDNCSNGNLTVIYSYAYAAANFIEKETKIKLLR